MKSKVVGINKMKGEKALTTEKGQKGRKKISETLLQWKGELFSPQSAFS